jgi:hypothetical protein
VGRERRIYQFLFLGLKKRRNGEIGVSEESEKEEEVNWNKMIRKMLRSVMDLRIKQPVFD